jgi:serine/threonine protein phosphatase PrpC
LRFAAKTDIGKLREVNEDCYAIITDCPGITAAFLVADGMGGHNSGEVASRVAVDEIRTALKTRLSAVTDDEEKDLSKLVEELIIAANRVVYSKAEQREEDHGMGTTIIVAVIADRVMHIGHSGRGNKPRKI